MSQRQTWPLSQKAGKSSGACSVCHSVRQTHLKDGTIHRHGPRDNPCPGSDKPPLASLPTQQQTATTPDAATSTSRAAATSSPATSSSFSTTHAVIASSISTTSAITPPVFSHPHVTGGIIKHIPKSARPACAALLASILRKVTADTNDLDAWSSLLQFGVRILLMPARTGKRHNLASIIKKRTNADDADPSEILSAIPASRRRKKKNAGELLAAAVMSKIEDGNMKAAIRILTSTDKPATDIDATYAKLQERHPDPPSDSRQATDPAGFSAIQVTEQQVMSAIRTFPPGSAGGPDGVRPQHILDLVCCRENGPALLTAITAFVNSLLDGKCHQAVTPILFGGTLMALEKKTGGIRPIAIGYTLRRIAAKCANAHATAVLSDYLQPLQLGVGTPGGCEAAVHATRRYMESMPDGHCVVKLDFTNAFNSLRRDEMLEGVQQRVPGIFKFIHLAYSQPTQLIYQNHIIWSRQGPQQGDPNGSGLFCNTIQPLLQTLQSELVEGYIDDLTLGGPEQQVARDVETVRRKGAELGLKLNEAKCEFICRSATSNDPIFQNFIHLKVEDAELLGAPITTGPAMDRALNNRCDDLARAASSLRLIASHDALILLRAAFSAPKLLHTLRASPCNGHPALDKFDGLLRTSISSITNTDLTDTQWIQASLPVRRGGLGIRRVSSLAPSAFLASAASTQDLQARILSGCHVTVDSAFDRVLAEWSALYNQTGILVPVGRDAAKQRAWDEPCTTADASKVMASQPDRHSQARLLALSAPHSGDWLHALPISSCGLRLDDEAVRVAVGLRLGAKLCQPHRCPCGANVQPEGTHGLACKRSAGRTARHHNLNDLVCRALIRAGVPSIKEPVGLLRSDGKRPDGLTQIPWQGGRCMTWDVTVTDSLADSYLTSTSVTAGAAAEGAASRKELKYQALAATHCFMPLAFETLGPINSKGIEFFTELGRRLSEVTGDSRETSFLFQRISIVIQRFNSICFHGSFQLSAADLDD